MAEMLRPTPRGTNLFDNYSVSPSDTETVYGLYGTGNVTVEIHEWISVIYLISRNMDIYVPPILIIFGLSGNALSVMILRSDHFRKCPCSMLLCFLAVVDAGVLLTGLLRIWIQTVFLLDIRVISTTSCRVHYFVTLLFQHASSWTVVMVTAERYVSVTRPIRAKFLCSRQKLACWFLGIVLCLCAVDAHVLFSLHIQEYEYYDPESGNYSMELGCHYLEGQYHYGTHVWPWVDCAVLALVPCSLIVVGNSLIVARVLRGRPRQSQAATYPHVLGRRRRVASMTWMLFAVTATFFLTTAPIEIYLLGFNHWDTETPVGNAKTLVAHVTCSLLYYANNAFNFLLYCVSGSRFRMALAHYWTVFRRRFGCVGLLYDQPSAGLFSRAKSFLASGNE